MGSIGEVGMEELGGSINNIYIYIYNTFKYIKFSVIKCKLLL